MSADWYIIIFSPGTGGNHLANIISTSPRLQSRISESFYDNLNNKNAHIDNNSNGHIIPCTPGNHIVCYHLSEYMQYKTAIDAINCRKKFLVIEFSQNYQELFYKRMLKLYPYYKDVFLINELATLYSTDVIKKLFDLDDITPVSANKIFTEDATHLVEYLNTNFDFQLTIEKVKEIHKKWIKMIEKTL
jgi:hypothetical protein